ncbi:MAG: PilZ domain-containing protein [Acidobacteria bacterium]|nr:PilZ domain-containing protein [Acidobacteriota bacterium]
MGKVRRSGRIAKEIRILLLGTDCTGKVFSEETHTVTLSRHGAGIVSKHKLAADGVATMRFLGGTTETTIRLVGELGQDARGYVYGVAFVDEEEDFWQLKFPPASEWNVAVDGPMQCQSCGRCEVVDQSEVEADVFALSESILRYCTFCGMPTEWRQAKKEVSTPAMPPADAVGVMNSPGEHSVAMLAKSKQAPARVDGMPQRAVQPSSMLTQNVRSRLPGVELLHRERLPAPALPPAAAAVVAKAANRRKDVRTRVNFSACVRYGNSEEIVECANLSKRGFAFRSRQQYPIGGEILVAVPFYPGTPPSFVTGSVRHVTELPNHNFQYGVMYLRFSGAARVAHDGYEIEHDQHDF